MTALNSLDNNLSISGYSGVKYGDVKGIWIHDRHVGYIPANLGSLFQLTAFASQNTHLIEIKAMDFSGMSNLHCLNVIDNLLKTVPIDAFSKFKQLRILNLNYNKMEELKNGLFDFNFNLEKIDLQRNSIKIIGSQIFNGLQKLENNNCIMKHYEGTLELTQLKVDIDSNCKHPNDAIDVRLNEMMKQINEQNKQKNKMNNKM